MKEGPIIIAGGGIAGLAAALALHGRDGIILEQSPTFEETGAGLQLGPNAVRALQKLGAWEAVSPYTSSPAEIHIWDGVGGRLLKRLKLGADFEKRFGAPYRLALRADLHRGLLAAVHNQPNISLKLGRTLENFRQGTSGVDASCTTEVFHGIALIAADGVNSQVRQSLFNNSPPLSSGEVFHRGLIANPETIDGIAFECVNLWLCPGGHIVHYPVGPQQHLNLVAVTSAGLVPRATFATCCDKVLRLVKLLENATIWPALYVKPLPHWNINIVVLIGDAAHGTLPYLAQGAAMALEDAASLQELLKDTRNVATCFDALSQARRKRTARLHFNSLRNGQNYHASGARRVLIQQAVSLAPSSVLLAGLNWIYSH